MKLVLLLSLMALLGCGSGPSSIPVMAPNGEVQSFPSSVYQETLTTIVQRELDIPQASSDDEYDLEVITLGLSLELGVGVRALEATTHTQLELHLRENK